MERMYNPENCKPLSKAEELEIFKRIQHLKSLDTDEADKEIVQLRNKIVGSNVGLVITIATHLSSYYARDDMIENGFIGLYKAIDRFVPDVNTKFSSFAFKVIMGTIVDSPGSYPIKALSLEQPVQDTTDEKLTLADTLDNKTELPPEEQIFKGMLVDKVRGCLQQLSRRDSEIISHRFGIGRHQPKTIKETARLFGLSQGGTFKIEKNALMMMKNMITDILAEDL